MERNAYKLPWINTDRLYAITMHMHCLYTITVFSPISMFTNILLVSYTTKPAVL